MVQVFQFSVDPQKKMTKSADIAGVRFDKATYEDVLTVVDSFVSTGRGAKLIVTPNPEMIVETQKDEEFRAILNDADLAVPDGIGILWAAYYLSLPTAKSRFREKLRLLGSLFLVLFKSRRIKSVLPQRVTGSDLLFKIVEASQKKGWRIFMLGAAPGVASIAIDRLIKKYPKAVFAGSFAGTPAVTHEDDLAELINRAEPDILFVAYGSPAQEKWIHRNLAKFETVKAAIGVGGAIDFAAGRAKRAPKIFRTLGLEWFWRVLREPRRIKRIWNATYVFIRLIFKLKMKQAA